MNWTCEDAVEWSQHKRDFSDFVDGIIVVVWNDFKDKSSERLKPTVEDNRPDNFNKRDVIFSHQVHFVLSVSDFPPIFVEAKGVVDMKLRTDGELFDIDDFHQ